MSKHIAIKLKPVAEKIIKQGHPWVFADSIEKISDAGDAGDLCILFDRKTNRIYAIGLLDPTSPIRVKVIHWGGQRTIDKDFFKELIQKAYLHRQPLWQNNITAYRLIFGENDGFPGLILDVYNQVGVLKLYSTIWLSLLDMLVPLLAETAFLQTVVLRYNRQLSAMNLPWKEGAVLYGKLEQPEQVFQEYGVLLKTNILRGHKTGFFLDQRENRRLIGKMSSGKTLLDVFSYIGGFSMHALRGGARKVLSLDMSNQALEMAMTNARLNHLEGKYSTRAGDAFILLNELIQEGKSFDIVVIDPPSFAKNEKERISALKKYKTLTELGVKLTRPGGILFLSSCSSRIHAEELAELHKQVFQKEHVTHRLIRQTGHDIDHPIRFKEAVYLKSFYYRIG